MTNLDKIYVTADLHFMHSKIIEYEQHMNFEDVVERDELIIKNWNNKIDRLSTVYIIGDVATYANRDGRLKLQYYLSRLNGIKTLVLGNHDTHLEKFYKTIFKEVTHYKELKINKELFCLFHYPILSWNKSHYGSYMIHGHIHDRDVQMPNGNILNVGIMRHNYTPLSLSEVKQTISERNKPLCQGL